MQTIKKEGIVFFRFELFGFCIDKAFDLKSFWILSHTIHYDDWNEKDRAFLLIGRHQGKWLLEIFWIWKFGPEELFPVKN